MGRLLKIYRIMSGSQRRWGVGVLILTVVSAIMDVLGVGSIMPFFAILANPELTTENETIKNLMSFFGLSSRQQLLIALGIAFFVLVIFSMALKATLVAVNERYVYLFSHTLSKRMLRTYMSQNYAWRLTRNSSELAKNVLADVDLIATMNVAPILNIVSAVISISLLLCLIFYVDPALAVLSVGILGGAFLLIYFSISRLLKRLGKKRVYSNAMRYTVSAEAFQSPKEQKIYQLASFFADRYSQHSRDYAHIEATTRTIRSIPRFALEALAFGGLLLVLLYWLSKGEGFDEALPVLALYAFAGYRLMPLLQLLFSSAAQLTISQAAVDVIFDDLKALSERTSTAGLSNLENSSVSFGHKIELRDVTFSYPSSSRANLTNLNLTIHSGTKVGIIGLSGSGKSTTVDVLLGLLNAKKGQLLIDGIIIDANNVPNWQSNIGFVPQDVSLVDDSVSANIAIGVEPKDWDIAQIERAAQAANLHDFVSRELECGYHTVLGEHGVRLSGGQRQRVAIARALYKRPKLLVLDEATSSLDNRTEAQIMKSIYALDQSVTVVMVTHRLSTVRDCDNIFLIDDGLVVAQGKYEELQSHSLFKELVNAPHSRSSPSDK